MESGIFQEKYKRINSNEEFRDMWMSLFDISVISSCNGKDPDLFCASALLKTAFYSFIKLKRRLIETEEMIESQRLALEAYERESKIVKSDSSSLTYPVCFRCGGAFEDSKSLPEERSTILKQTFRNTDDVHNKDSRICSRFSNDEISCSVNEEEVSKGQDQQISSGILLSKQVEINILEAVNLMDSDDSNCVSSPVSQTKLCYPKQDVDDSAVLVHCTTPEKSKYQAESQDASPILKNFKKPKLSPALSLDSSKCEKKLHKSPSLIPSENITSLKIDLTKGHSGLFTARRKISPDSLRLRKTRTNSEFKVSNEGSPEAQKSSENEEVDIILPSPVSPKSMSYISSKGILAPLEADEEDARKRQRSMGQGPSDTEVTFFLPMEDTGSSETLVEENNDLIHGDEPGQIAFLDSFDQFPLKSDSPPYKYQRAAVRKKKERRKLSGWECKDCQKYYEAAGLSSGEKREHLNKCSRHRDKFPPEDNLPAGFWNPVFPETPQ